MGSQWSSRSDGVICSYFLETPYIERHIGGPMSPIVKFFVCIFFLGSRAWQKFSGQYLEKMLGKSFRQGVRPHNFWNSDCVPHRVMCLQNFIQISLKLWPVDVCEHSKNVILAPLRLCPRAQMGPSPQHFYAYVFLGQGHDSLKFSDRYLEKMLGKIFHREVGPPKFLK